MSNSYFLFSLFLLQLFLFSFEDMKAQTNDNIIWASMKLHTSLGDKTTLAIAPTLRLNDDISDYQNMSIDISLKQKLSKNWSVQLLERTWFIPNGTNRQFLWLDLIYGRAFGNIHISSGLRYHYAFDIKESVDSDFFRWKTIFSLLNLGRIKPFIGIEPWFQTNKIGDFRNIRYIAGLNYKLNEQLGLGLKYWRQETMNLEPSRDFNIYLMTLSYKLISKKN
ncbi:MAG: DUF2490 domain-containing protein [Chitinophagales bacterium]